jgi:UPF0755 protein
VVLGASLWFASFVFGALRFGPQALDFDIERGASLRVVARKLKLAGVTSDALRFELLARALARDGVLKAGSYQLDPRWSGLELLEALTGQAYRLDKIVILEGWTFQQMRASLDSHSGLRHDTQGMSDQAILDRLALSHGHPEGLFFPDTYNVAKGSSDLSVLRRAADRMQATLDKHWRERQPDLPLIDPYQALILASVIEKETGRDADRALVSAVFTNRLRKGMRLQADPTVIYGLGRDFDGNLRRRDLETDNPYNTYTRAGLPPTPIALVGLASLRAALNPASSNALYFVARGDGTSHFSETLTEHNRAVTKYQRQRADSK